MQVPSAGYYFSIDEYDSIKNISEYCRKNKISIYINVTNLSYKEVNYIENEFSVNDFLLVYCANDVEMDSYYRHIVWLQARNRNFSVISNNIEQLVIASISGASAIICELEADQLNVLIDSITPSNDRPFTRDEVDKMNRKKIGLTVKKLQKAGSIITSDSLAVKKLNSLSLSATLKSKLIGCSLRYDVSPGEPITFGHIYPNE